MPQKLRAPTNLSNQSQESLRRRVPLPVGLWPPTAEYVDNCSSWLSFSLDTKRLSRPWAYQCVRRGTVEFVSFRQQRGDCGAGHAENPILLPSLLIICPFLRVGCFEISSSRFYISQKGR